MKTLTGWIKTNITCCRGIQKISHKLPVSYLFDKTSLFKNIKNIFHCNRNFSSSILIAASFIIDGISKCCDLRGQLLAISGQLLDKTVQQPFCLIDLLIKFSKISYPPFFNAKEQGQINFLTMHLSLRASLSDLKVQKP